jgi:hypothetical protein
MVNELMLRWLGHLAFRAQWWLPLPNVEIFL